MIREENAGVERAKKPKKERARSASRDQEELATETKEPMFVHCATCRHEWIAAWLPMPIDRMAALLKAPCPKCGGKKRFMGKYPAPTPKGDPLAWRNGGDTGTSSITIWSVMMNVPLDRSGTPSDPSDFGRCYRLLEIMPEWKLRLSEVATRYPAWQKLVLAWMELTALYEEELPSGTCPKLYQRMKQLRGE